MDGFGDTLCFLAGMNDMLWSVSFACATTFLLFGAWCCFQHHCRSLVDATGPQARWLVVAGSTVLLLLYGAASINTLGSMKRIAARHAAAGAADLFRSALGQDAAD